VYLKYENQVWRKVLKGSRRETQREKKEQEETINLKNSGKRKKEGTRNCSTAFMERRRINALKS